MKYVILIHSNPQPWGHLTSDYLEAHKALPSRGHPERALGIVGLVVRVQRLAP